MTRRARRAARSPWRWSGAATTRHHHAEQQADGDVGRDVQTIAPKPITATTARATRLRGWRGARARLFAHGDERGGGAGDAAMAMLPAFRRGREAAGARDRGATRVPPRRSFDP